MIDKRIITILKNALNEDKARFDVTTGALIPKKKKISATIVAREKGIVCGLAVAERLFKLLDKGIKFEPYVKDGVKIKKGSILARVCGKARPILSAERSVLNFLGHLSGIATLTGEFIAKTKPYKVKILDTRKTTPNLRILEKYAVRCAGGYNHRFDLSDQVLIKDNHLAVTCCPMLALSDIINIVKRKVNKKKIEIEVNNIREFKEALLAGPDIIMLDNFTLGDIRKAVKIKGQDKTKLEVSGGITLAGIKKIAACRVDRISLGALTHSAKSLDISLEVPKAAN